MNYTKEKYVDEVMLNVHGTRKLKKRFKEDLLSRIEESMSDDPYYNIEESMGTPRDLADEFMENMESGGDSIIFLGMSYSQRRYEFKSKLTMFGLPFIHINTGGKYGNSYAKGIIAIGDIATGVLAIGGVSSGFIAIGGIALGVFALGGVALGGVAVGGVAMGAYAVGGVANGFVTSLGGLEI
jgi:hypothetical protein